MKSSSEHIKASSLLFLREIQNQLDKHNKTLETLRGDLAKFQQKHPWSHLWRTENDDLKGHIRRIKDEVKWLETLKRGGTPPTVQKQSLIARKWSEGRLWFQMRRLRRAKTVGYYE